MLNKKSNFSSIFFARDIRYSLVDINVDEVDPDKPYFCLGCGEKVQAIIAKKYSYVNFFVHKNQKPCPKPESYIHWTSKELLYNLWQKIPSFLLELDDQTIDLKKMFPRMALEEFNLGYDVNLVLYSNRGKKLYFELLYSKKKSNRKIALGYPVVELRVSSEKDIKKVVKIKKICKKESDYQVHNISTIFSSSVKQKEDDGKDISKQLTFEF